MGNALFSFMKLSLRFLENYKIKGCLQFPLCALNKICGLGEWLEFDHESPGGYHFKVTILCQIKKDIIIIFTAVKTLNSHFRIKNNLYHKRISRKLFIHSHNNLSIFENRIFHV